MRAVASLADGWEMSVLFGTDIYSDFDEDGNWTFETQIRNENGTPVGRKHDSVNGFQTALQVADCITAFNGDVTSDSIALRATFKTADEWAELADLDA